MGGLESTQLLSCLIRFDGYNRGFGEEGSSRVDLPMRLQLDANDMSVISSDEGRRGSFGEARVYAAIPGIKDEMEDIEGMPEWAESKKPTHNRSWVWR